MATGSASDVDFEKVDLDSLTHISKFISNGNFGEVYGPFTGSSKQFAVKKILIGEGRPTDYKIKVKHKANIWTSLKHEHLIEIHHVSLEPKAVYIVMEYASGGSLRHLLDKSDVKVHHQIDVSNWSRQIAEGMLYLHDSGNVHRDLKSSNIVLMEPFDPLNAHVETTLKITDFDSVQEHVGTATMSLCGTCTHMAPEVLTKQWFSKASDVWSYGVVIWEILTRELPHNGQTMGPLVTKALSGKLTLSIPESIPKEIKELLRDCWRHDTTRRLNFKGIVDRLNSICENKTKIQQKVNDYKDQETARRPENERLPQIPEEIEPKLQQGPRRMNHVNDLPSTERDLADDANWKVMQKNTFTRWANEHLRQVNKVIGDLEFDLHDGVRLSALVEVLSGKKLPKYNRRPSYKNQKLENVSICLDFLQIEEGIKLVNIDSSDIVSCNSKLILGLMWTLILNYSIAFPVWDDLVDDKQTPKQKLLGWITSRIPDKPIRNFTTDWNDGTAIGALVDAVAPGLCPDWPTWNPKNNIANAMEAMNAAEQWLDVPPLVKPVEMCNPKVDEMSMMTYLSQFPSATMKQGAPLRPRKNPSPVRAYEPAFEAHKCYVTGRGIQPKGVRVDDHCDFTVHTENAESEVIAKVVGSGGIEEKLVLKKLDPKMYKHSYVPKEIGLYVVSVTYDGQAVLHSPFRVEVGPKKKSKYRVLGPGLQYGIVGYSACFTLVAEEFERFGFSIEGPSEAKVDWKDNGDGSADFSYWPTAAGEYAIHVLTNEEDIPQSPFMADVSPSTTEFNPTKVEVHGPGILKTGVTVSKWAEFVVDARLAGNAPLNIVATEVGNNPVDVVVKDNKDETYSCRYMPRHGVKHVIFIAYGNVAVPNSPFRVFVMDASRVKVFGSALDRPVRVHQPTHLIVDCSEAGSGEVVIDLTNERGIDIDFKTEVTCDNIFRVDFEATSTGTYSACIFFGDSEIPNSPFKIHVQPNVDATEVAIKRLEKNQEKKSKPERICKPELTSSFSVSDSWNSSIHPPTAPNDLLPNKKSSFGSLLENNSTNACSSSGFTMPDGGGSSVNAEWSNSKRLEMDIKPDLAAAEEARKRDQREQQKLKEEEEQLKLMEEKIRQEVEKLGQEKRRMTQETEQQFSMEREKLRQETERQMQREWENFLKEKEEQLRLDQQRLQREKEENLRHQHEEQLRREKQRMERDMEEQLRLEREKLMREKDEEIKRERARLQREQDVQKERMQREKEEKFRQQNEEQLRREKQRLEKETEEKIRLERERLMREKDELLKQERARLQREQELQKKQLQEQFHLEQK